jgi:hypothetical protein
VAGWLRVGQEGRPHALLRALTALVGGRIPARP